MDGYSFDAVKTGCDWMQYHTVRQQSLYPQYAYKPDQQGDSTENQHHFVLRYNGGVVGAIRIDVPESAEHKDMAIFRRVAVDMTRQKCGTGRILMALAEAFCAEIGRATICLNAREGTDAFYRKLGYTADAWDLPGDVRSATSVQMVKKLDLPARLRVA